MLMCRAMNRSARNVLFGAFGRVEAEAGRDDSVAKGTVRTIVPDEVPGLLDGARSVIIVPGYGMAVAQAQHGVAEPGKPPPQRGLYGQDAIPPVAGRIARH